MIHTALPFRFPQWRQAILVVLAVAASWALPAQAQTPAQPQKEGRVAGIVTDRASGRPLAEVQLSMPGLAATATSDSAGRFVIAKVAIGTRSIRAIRIGMRPVVITDILVNVGRTTQVAIEMQDAPNTLNSVSVVAATSALATVASTPNSRISMSYEEIRRSPGAIGDVSRLVQSLPGVLTGNDTRNDIIARGGSPTENLMLLDGFEIPNINHFAVQGSTGGPIGMINNELLREATFVAGGFSSQYGNRLSSMLDIRLREGNRDRWRSELDVSNAGAGLIFEGPLTKKGSLIVSGRQSFLDLIAPAIGLTAVPYTTNFQTKATYEPTTRDRLWAVGLGGFDRIDFSSTAADTTDPDPIGTTRVRGNRWTGGLGWQRLMGANSYGTLLVSASTLGQNLRVIEAALGTTPVFRNKARENEYTARYDLHVTVPRIGKFVAGASAKSLSITTDLASPFGVQNPFSLRARVDPVAIDTSVTTSIVGGYLEFSRAATNRAEITLSGRVDRYGLSEETRVSPRAAVVVHVTPTLDLTGTVGRYYQQVPLVYSVNVAANRTLDPIRADHAIAGLAWTPREDLRFSLEGYTKEYEDYPVAVQYGQLSLANTGDQVSLADGALTPLRSTGSGRVRGAEFFVQKKFTGRTYGQLSYAWSQTRHRGADQVLRTGAFDVPNLATLIVGQKRGTKWEYSARTSYGSGRPISPVLTNVSQTQDRLVLDATRLNTLRAPDYFRVDLRLDRRFAIRRGTLATYIELQNVSGRENQSVQIWNSKTNKVEYQEQIAFLPVIGMNWKF
jgi:Carboxypeptidase regulatory-like domain/TonB-dependent Receptor Plug Domain